jgi:hypothetical protein
MRAVELEIELCPYTFKIGHFGSLQPGRFWHGKIANMLHFKRNRQHMSIKRTAACAVTAGVVAALAVFLWSGVRGSASPAAARPTVAMVTVQVQAASAGSKEVPAYQAWN